MALSLMVEADSINVLALNMGQVSVDIDGIELLDKMNDIVARHFPSMLPARS
mgnify:FL=1